MNNDKRIKKLTLMFVGFIIAFTFLCISILISNYDSLARYPYEDQKGRTLIKQHLNRDEIEYIIEKSIGPNMFIRFIEEDNFNIYHYEDYKMLAKVAWDLPPKEIVDTVERTRDIIPTKKLAKYLSEGKYSLNEVLEFEKYKNTFLKGTRLIVGADKLDAYIENDQTLYKRFPKRLVELDDSIPHSKKPLYIDQRMQTSLKNMIDALNLDLYGSKSASQIEVDRAYISYEQQERLYQLAVDKYGKENVLEYEFYPGTSEHQLGLAVDFIIPGILEESFNKTAEAQWLSKHAYQYGFIQTFTNASESYTKVSAKPYHYRYVGIEMSNILHDEKKSFAEYKYDLMNKLDKEEKSEQKKTSIDEDDGENS